MTAAGNPLPPWCVRNTKAPIPLATETQPCCESSTLAMLWGAISASVRVRLLLLEYWTLPHRSHHVPLHTILIQLLCSHTIIRGIGLEMHTWRKTKTMFPVFPRQVFPYNRLAPRMLVHNVFSHLSL